MILIGNERKQPLVIPKWFTHAALVTAMFATSGSLPRIHIGDSVPQRFGSTFVVGISPCIKRYQAGTKWLSQFAGLPNVHFCSTERLGSSIFRWWFALHGSISLQFNFSMNEKPTMISEERKHSFMTKAQMTENKEVCSPYIYSGDMNWQ